MSEWIANSTKARPGKGARVLTFGGSKGIAVAVWTGFNFQTIPGLWTIYPTHWQPLPAPPK